MVPDPTIDYQAHAALRHLEDVILPAGARRMAMEEDLRLLQQDRNGVSGPTQRLGLWLVRLGERLRANAANSTMPSASAR
ncbi:MAG: hypothetical protein AB7R89_05110 [Dehalococcoidia bacterium]